MTTETGKYAGDQLFHAISHDNYTTTVHFMYFLHHKLEATQVLNGPPCVIFEELLFNLNDFITRSGIDRATMGTWDIEKRTFAASNELHNEEAMKVMFEGTGLTDLDLAQDLQAVMKKKWTTLMSHIFRTLTHV